MGAGPPSYVRTPAPSAPSRGSVPPVSPSSGPARRSGDPRRRSAASTEPPPDRRRLVAVVVAVVVGAAVLALALVATRSGAERAPDARARRHVEAACDLTGKAGDAAEATTVDARSRYAASVLLLDRAIIESARAAESDPALADLDTALQDVHTAGHERDPEGWQSALDEALAECRTVLG